MGLEPIPIRYEATPHILSKALHRISNPLYCTPFNVHGLQIRCTLSVPTLGQ
jgi:hypothetical protein